MSFMDTKSPTPSPELYAEIRAGFVRQRSSLNKWCIANKVFRENARSALLGQWTGPKAQRLIETLVKASQTP